jgi:hypothetical protein
MYFTFVTFVSHDAISHTITIALQALKSQLVTKAHFSDVFQNIIAW